MQIGEIRDLDRSLQGRARLQVHLVAEDAEGHRRPVRHRLQAEIGEPSFGRPSLGWLDEIGEHYGGVTVPVFRRRVTYPQRLHSIAGPALFRLGGPPEVASFLLLRGAVSPQRSASSSVFERSVCVGRSRSVRYCRVASGASPRLLSPLALALPLAGCLPAQRDHPGRHRHSDGLSRRRRAMPTRRCRRWSGGAASAPRN